MLSSCPDCSDWKTVPSEDLLPVSLGFLSMQMRALDGWGNRNDTHLDLVLIVTDDVCLYPGAFPNACWDSEIKATQTFWKIVSNVIVYEPIKSRNPILARHFENISLNVLTFTLRGHIACNYINILLIISLKLPFWKNWSINFPQNFRGIRVEDCTIEIWTAVQKDFSLLSH